MPSLDVRWWQAVVLLGIGALTAALAIGLREVAAFEGLEHSTLQKRFAIRGEGAPSPDVVIVGLDNESLLHVDRPPLPRDQHGEVVDHLRDAGARVIAYDFAFEQPTDKAADLALARAFRRAPAAAVSVSLTSPGGGVEPLAGRVAYSATVQAGSTTVAPDNDGVIRRFPEPDNGVPPFATVAAALHERRPMKPAPARALIDFRGGAGHVSSLSFINVLDDDFHPDRVRGRTVVVGPTAPNLLDLQATGVGGAPMSGPEIQANAITTALAGYPLRTLPSAATALLLLVLALTGPIALSLRALKSRIGWRSVAAAAAIALGAWTVAAQLAFGAGAVVDYSAGVFALLAWSAGAGGLVAFAGRRERREQRELFAEFSPDVVKQVLRHDSVDPAALTNTEIIAGYRLEEVIGVGGMGVVYRAVQLDLGREVALKLIRPGQALNPDFRARFKREAASASAIAHQNIVPVYEASVNDGLLYIAMALVKGTDVAKMLKLLRSLDPAHVLMIVDQIASALDAAHLERLVHRDVKPANILVTGDFRHAYLTDFGIAKHIDGSDGLTRPGGWVGTIDYLAPELIEGDEASPRSDIYALTAVVYHCVTGAVPFDLPSDAAKLRAHAASPPPTIVTTGSDAPAALDAVIARGMAKDPVDRYATASELAFAVARAYGPGGEPQPEPPPPGPQPHGSGDEPTEASR